MKPILAVTFFAYFTPLWAAEKIQFNRDVRPILSDKSFTATARMPAIAKASCGSTSVRRR